LSVAVGAKANVLQSVGFVLLVASLLILSMRWLFICHFYFVNLLSCRSFRVSANGSRLGDVAEIEAQMFSFVEKFNRRTELEFSTKPAILPNRCYAFALI